MSIGNGNIYKLNNSIQFTDFAEFTFYLTFPEATNQESPLYDFILMFLLGSKLKQNHFSTDFCNCSMKYCDDSILTVYMLHPPITHPKYMTNTLYSHKGANTQEVGLETSHCNTKKVRR